MDSGPETIERVDLAESSDGVLARFRHRPRSSAKAPERATPVERLRTARLTGRVSVLVPTYNRGPMLSECLASIMHQTVSPHQVIVVDDGSTDDTAQRVAKFGPRVQYLYQENRGKAHALNTALARVTGEFVWLFDDDDVALPTAIASRVAIMDATPDAEVVLSKHYWGASGSDGRIEVREKATWPSIDSSDLLFTLMRGCFTSLQGALVRTECYRRIGPFREELLRSQDYEMLLRLARNCKVVLLDRPTFVVRRHDGERGPAPIRHSEAAKEQHWARYDAMIGQGLRQEASLGEYLTPPITGTLTLAQTRDALLNRMSVMASKGLGREFVEDAIAFADASDDRQFELTAEQRRAAVAAVQQRYFLLSVVPQPAELVRRARALAQRPLGRPLLRAFVRGLLGLANWGARSAHQRWQILRLAALLAWLGWGPRVRRR